MKKQSLKDFPSFATDKEAEDFVDNADLSEYDFSGFKTVKYEFEPKNTTINLRISESLLQAIKNKAEKSGIPYTRFIRMVLEQSVA